MARSSLPRISRKLVGTSTHEGGLVAKTHLKSDVVTLRPKKFDHFLAHVWTDYHPFDASNIGMHERHAIDDGQNLYFGIRILREKFHFFDRQIYRPRAENSYALTWRGTCYAANLTQTFQRSSPHFAAISDDRILPIKRERLCEAQWRSVGVAELPGQGGTG